MSFYTPQQHQSIHMDANSQDASLPTVLLLGDSISIGYSPYVRDALAGIANIVRPSDAQGMLINCGSTAFGVEELDAWLAECKADIIHFNWGLHDIAYRHPDAQVYGNRDKINGTLSVTPFDYAQNLQIIVQKLRTTGAKLVWATTTVVPPDEAGRFVGDEVKYNAIAQNIMQQMDIPVNDLYAVTAPFAASMFVCPGDVHYTEEGYQIVARQVVDALMPLLRDL